jgi:hypothetical protein
LFEKVHDIEAEVAGNGSHGQRAGLSTVLHEGQEESSQAAGEAAEHFERRQAARAQAEGRSGDKSKDRQSRQQGIFARLEGDSTHVGLSGLRLPNIPQQCSCQKPLTVEHLVHCGPSKLLRHNMLQARLVAFAHQHGVGTVCNTRYTFEEAKGRSQRREPDVVFFPAVDDLKPIETDVTIVNPCAPHRLQSGEYKYTTNRAKARKIKKYLTSARAQDHNFLPLCFETHGNIDSDVKDLLHIFASRTPGVQGLAVRDMQVDLAVALARGNAECARILIGSAQYKQDMDRAVQPVPIEKH